MHPALAQVTHRPWPLPARPWTWRQSWLDLLFVHWPVPATALRAWVPTELEIDEFDGTSYVGVVPFRMAGVMRRPLPDLPGLSAFPELNVRLYVTKEGKPGVWFLSLDATNAVAVWAARRFFHLPYHRAHIDIRATADGFSYDSRRAHGAAAFRGSYGPTGPVKLAEPGTLDHWLTERYCLYARSPSGALWRNDVHHAPWPLQPAWATIEENSLLEPFGLSPKGPPPLLHFAGSMHVVVWNAEPVGTPK